jgi:hypothetical protein
MAAKILPFPGAQTATPARDAALRLLHVRDFLEQVDQHFPWGVPLEITHAIREELDRLEAAADAAIERAR